MVTQAEFYSRAKSIVENNVKTVAKHNKKCYDRGIRVPRTQPSVGSVVYLKQCAFPGRHKVKDSYMKDPFVGLMNMTMYLGFAQCMAVLPEWCIVLY